MVSTTERSESSVSLVQEVTIATSIPTPPATGAVSRRYRVRVDFEVIAYEAQDAVERVVDDCALVGLEPRVLSTLPLEAVPIVVEHRRDKEVGEWDPAVIDMAARYRVTLPKWRKDAAPWRVIPDEDQHQGEVNGLPGLRGKCICTNGILAILVREDGRWTDIHIASFKGDLSEEIRALVKARAPKEVANKPKSATQKALELYA